MTLLDTMKSNFTLKALSLCLALLLWLFVSAGRESETSLTVPVQLNNIPPGLAVAAPLPPTVNFRLRGTKIQLWKYSATRRVIKLDLKGATEGATSFPNLGALLDLPEDLKTTRVTPSAIVVTLVKSGGREKGKL
jgi:hypothetical protein